MQKIKNTAYNILRWSESFTKLDMIYLAKSGFWLTLSQFISSFSSLILSILFANLLPADVYGIYRYVLSVFSILTISTLSGVNTAVVRSVAQNHNYTILKALKTKITWGIIGLCLGISISAYYLFQSNINLFGAFLIISLFVPFMDSFFIYDSVIQGTKDFKKSYFLFAISQIFSLIIISSTLYITDNLWIILLSYFIPWTASRGLFLYFVYKQEKIEKIPDTLIEEETIKYGKKLSAINIINNISLYIDQILIYHFIGPTQLAIYYFAVNVPENIKNFLKFIQPTYLPVMAEKNAETIKPKIISGMYKLGLILIPLIIFYIIFAPLLFKTIFPAYKDAIQFSQLFSISLIYFVTAIPITYFQAHKKTQSLYKYYSYSSIIQIFILVLLIPFFGIIGAIIAKIIARFVSIIIIKIILEKNE